MPRSPPACRDIDISGTASDISMPGAFEVSQFVLRPESVLTELHTHEFLLVCSNCAGTACLICGSCGQCATRFEIQDGILSLLNAEHPFYEGAYDAQIRFPESRLKTVIGRCILPFVGYGYLKAIVDHVSPGALVLELGCGGGTQLVASRYQVTAVDLSLVSLRKTPAGYRHKLRADITKLEFVPGTFDSIVASCFWEHFTPIQKDRLASQFVTWLKPGGTLVLLFDTASENPLFRWFRKFPNLYQKSFIDHDGHLGLESVTENLRRFETVGLKKVRGIGLNRTIQHLPVYIWMLPYAEVSSWARRLAELGSRLHAAPRIAQIFTCALHLWDVSLGRIFPTNWSRLFLGVWRKV